MIGADPKGLADETDELTAAAAAVGGASSCPASGGGDEGPPMQSWSGWWFVRTYLQSLGQVLL